jgi:SNW domain-containing protein 1
LKALVDTVSVKTTVYFKIFDVFSLILFFHVHKLQGAMRKNKIDRDQNRDVSEKIALGMLKGSGKFVGEELYDSRLFNQSAGLDSGFGAEDEYSTYTKPLFDRGEASTIYRPKRDDADMYGDVDTQLAKLSDTSRFKPDKGFKGAEGGTRSAPRDAPVQFERHREEEEDAFGIEDIVQNKRARRDDD